MGLCLYFMLGREIPLETLSQVPAVVEKSVRDSRDNEDDGTFCFYYELWSSYYNLHVLNLILLR